VTVTLWRTSCAADTRERAAWHGDSQSGELERGELSWTVYRRERSFRGATSQFRSENQQYRCYGECDKRRGDRQLATHGTIMCLALRLPRLPALVETRAGGFYSGNCGLERSIA
jgi:hypothetical protein